MPFFVIDHIHVAIKKVKKIRKPKKKSTFMPQLWPNGYGMRTFTNKACIRIFI